MEMSWIGKIFGGTMGFLFGGPIGAIGGAALGHYLIDEDERIIQRPNDGIQGLQNNEEKQAIFFITTFSLLAKLTKADGVVSREEIRAIDQLMTRDLRMHEQARKYAIQVFHAAKTSQSTFEDYATQFYQNFSEQPQILRSMVDVLLRVAAADRDYHPKEEKLILDAVRIFGISRREYDALRARHIPDTDKYYKILRSDKRTSNELIKKNYRKLVNEYHPDKIVSKGLPPEFEEFAKKKFQEIQEAFERVRQERGIS